MTLSPLQKSSVNSDQGGLGVQRVLGSGLWGSVVELGDGSVRKLSRRFTAGIGDGLAKAQREIAVLTACGHVATAPLILPKIIGWVLPEDRNELLQIDMTKVTGLVRQSAELRKLPVKEQSSVAQSIGRALADLHKVFQQTDLKDKISSAERYRQELVDGFSDDSESVELLGKITHLVQQIEPYPSVIIHGDFNLSNLLFHENTVVSVIDFAECRLGWPEEDLAAIIDDLPTIQGTLITSYQQATGIQVSPERLAFALAFKNLLSFAILKRLGKTEAAASVKDTLANFILTHS